ncbi:hypothetical protein GCM10010518_37600 [Kitasatospora cinereorecta]
MFRGASASAPASRSTGRDASLKGVTTQQNRPSSSPPAGPEKPGRIATVAALNALEGAALVIGGVYMLVMGLLGRPDSPQQAEMGGLTLLALGLIPLFAARGLRLRRSWSRGPALITQIMALPVAWTLLRAQGALIPAGIALAAVAVTALVLLLDPTTTRALGIRGPRATPGA